MLRGFLLGVAVTMALLYLGPRLWDYWQSDRAEATPPPTRATVAPTTTVAPMPAPKLIVRVASETDRAKAERIEARLKRRFPGQPVGVLRSDDYYGLRAGYWVPYVGPFSDTEEGRKAAQAAHAKVPGSIIGTIRHR